MRIQASNEPIEIFTILPRTNDPGLYADGVKTVTRLSQEFEFTGVLIFTGNDVFIDPWITAHQIVTQTSTLCPLVAVNPTYMHPFTAARMISSLANFYKRKVYLNLVTGTAVSHLEALGDTLSHDERYERLEEYAQIINLLLGASGLVNFPGKFYRLSDLVLLPKTPPALLPGLLVAGQSESAKRVCRAVGATGTQMLKPELEAGLGHERGIHFGVVTRENEMEAWTAAGVYFPEDDTGRDVFEFSMSNTDSRWKQQLRNVSRDAKDLPKNYFLNPFLRLQADCPFIVGGYEYVANLFVKLIQAGIRTFILDIPPNEEEFEHCAFALDLAGRHPSLQALAGTSGKGSHS
jgi:alkanesulfonate monooxygenase